MKITKHLHSYNESYFDIIYKSTNRTYRLRKLAKTRLWLTLELKARDPVKLLSTKSLDSFLSVPSIEYTYNFVLVFIHCL